MCWPHGRMKTLFPFGKCVQTCHLTFGEHIIKCARSHLWQIHTNTPHTHAQAHVGTHWHFSKCDPCWGLNQFGFCKFDPRWPFCLCWPLLASHAAIKSDGISKATCAYRDYVSMRSDSWAVWKKCSTNVGALWRQVFARGTVSSLSDAETQLEIIMYFELYSWLVDHYLCYFWISSKEITALHL